MRPICEPVELPFGASVVAERVIIAADVPRIGSFAHFHDVVELVLFRRVSGQFIADGSRHLLSDGAITFVPSMRCHDFALEKGAMEWVLVQLDPYIAESLILGSGANRLARPFCAWPNEKQRVRIDALADWLLSAGPSDDEIRRRIVELLLLAITEAPERQALKDRADSASVERLLPALERLRAAPAQPLTLQCAAAMCSMSPPYFSRRFREVLKMTFTDYARIYRLHLAARRLIATGATISAIAYSSGFSSPAHFAARFRTRFGMTPREYRRGARSRAEGN
ncbi:MAG TPA: AraC family transcriptional regulator [Sphingomicrobium sp.]|nr:AraC family transcriptional regulator [Sphingomicrobium sp.]